MEREADLSSGDDSIVLYERWVDERDQAILDGIEELQPRGLPLDLPPARVAASSGRPTRRRRGGRDRLARAARGARDQARGRGGARRAGGAARGACSRATRRRRGSRAPARVPPARGEAGLVGVLRPARDDELGADRGHGVDRRARVGRARSRRSSKKSLIYTLSFPTQQHKLDAGDEVVDPRTGESAGSLVELDDVAGRLKLRRGPKFEGQPLPQALIPGGAWNTKAPARGADAARRARCATATGATRRSRASCGASRRSTGARVQVDRARRDEGARRSRRGAAPLRPGPPGSGKTWTGARLILHLLARGKRVGDRRDEPQGDPQPARRDRRSAALSVLRGLKKSSGGNPESSYERAARSRARSDIEPFLDPELRLLAGTAWLFARPELDQAARLPLHRRGRPGLARRRARDGHLGARRSSCSATRCSSRRSRRARTRAARARRCSSTCSATRRRSRRIAASSSSTRSACTRTCAASSRTRSTRAGSRPAEGCERPVDGARDGPAVPAGRARGQSPLVARGGGARARGVRAAARRGRGRTRRASPRRSASTTSWSSRRTTSR